MRIYIDKTALDDIIIVMHGKFWSSCERKQCIENAAKLNQHI